MEYSSIVFDLISEDERKTICAIQNDALRIIFKKDREFSNKKLNSYEMLNESIIDITTSSCERSSNEARSFGNALV
jgi:hypothetical protein